MNSKTNEHNLNFRSNILEATQSVENKSSVMTRCTNCKTR